MLFGFLPYSKDELVKNISTKLKEAFLSSQKILVFMISFIEE